jgi:hypothetical protein
MNQWWKQPKTETPGTGNLGNLGNLGNTGTATGVGGTTETNQKKAGEQLSTDVPTTAMGTGLNMSVSKPGEVIAKLALEGGPKVVQQVTAFKGGGGQLVFQPGGTRLNGTAAAHGGVPQALLLEVPPQFRKMRLFSLSLSHQQNLTEKSTPWNGKKSSAPGGQQDQSPGMSLVDAHVVGKGWITLSEKKFAEARNEVETLHDLNMIPLGVEIDAIRVRSAAVDPVHVNKVAINFLPQDRPASFNEGIFRSGISFGDPWKGQHNHVFRDTQPMKAGETRYPGAVTLNNNGGWADTPQTTLDKLGTLGWHADHDSVLIPLTGTLKTVEVAIGDTDPANKFGETKNNDGSQGRKGYAELTIEVERANGKRYTLLSGENVPPQGVLIGAAGPDYKPEPGDKLRVSVDADAAGIMGIRVGYGA